MEFLLFTEEIITDWLSAESKSGVSPDTTKIKLTLNGIVRRFEEITDRKFVRDDYVETVTGYGDKVFPKALPVHSVTSIKPRVNGVFSEDHEISASNYYTNLADNSITLHSLTTYWNQYELVYDGGYDKYNTDDGENNLPEGLAKAIMKQLQFEQDNIDKLGQTSVTTRDGTTTRTTVDLLPEVREVLNHYKRLM